MEFDWTSVVRMRLSRQHLLRPAESIEAAVVGMVGAHAQVASAAELSIAVRTVGVHSADVRAAIAPGGVLVKTIGPRGTVHLLPRSELALWCSALGALPATTSLPAADGLSESQERAVVEAIGQVLASKSARDAPPDSDELGTRVIELTGAWAADPVTPAFGTMAPRWRQAIGAAARHGVLAYGPNRGNRVTYVDPDVRVEADTGLAIGWLLDRFLHSYGPATPRQFARWLGVRPAIAIREFERRTTELERVRFAGDDAFLRRDDPVLFRASPPAELREERAARVMLLPHFDPYVIGSFPRELLFPGLAATRALTHGQAGTRPVLVIDGVVRGIWSARRTGGRLELTVELFDRAKSTVLGELDRAGARLGQFLGLDGHVVPGDVAAGAHL